MEVLHLIKKTKILVLLVISRLFAFRGFFLRLFFLDIGVKVPLGLCNRRFWLVFGLPCRFRLSWLPSTAHRCPLSNMHANLTLYSRKRDKLLSRVCDLSEYSAYHYYYLENFLDKSFGICDISKRKVCTFRNNLTGLRRDAL